MTDAQHGRLRWLAWLQAVSLACCLGLAFAPAAQAQPATHTRTAPTADCPPTAQTPDAAQQRQAQPAATDRGLLWRISKAGRSSWLYGTLHVGRPSWSSPGPRVRQALQSADTLALEIDNADPAMAASMARGLARLRQAEDSTPPPAALLARLAAQAHADCLDAPGFLAQPALLQVTVLTVLAGRRDGLDPAFGQDLALATLARATGKTLVSLEDPESQFAALLPDDPAALDTLLHSSLAQLEDGSARRLLPQLAALWAAGDLARLADPTAWCNCLTDDADRAQLQRLNDARNPALADRIAALHDQGHRVFAAVGALHMTGAMALPRLLAARGFTVERSGLAPATGR